jgi:DNA-directed RNA polymerase subunit P
MLKSKNPSVMEEDSAVEKITTGIVYECLRCGAKVSTEELELRGGEIKCTVCGYRVLKKMRPPVVKRVQAR